MPYTDDQVDGIIRRFRWVIDNRGECPPVRAAKRVLCRAVSDGLKCKECQDHYAVTGELHPKVVETGEHYA
jgi:hypothetical protein